MNTTYVRRANQGDLRGLFMLCVLMHQETQFSCFDFCPEMVMTELHRWCCTDASVGGMLVAVRDGVVIGMLGVHAKQTWFGKDKFASEEVFFVHPDYRGTRTAFKLMGEFMKWAQSLQIEHVRAGVATGGSESAERLYEHFGMHKVGSNFIRHF